MPPPSDRPPLSFLTEVAKSEPPQTFHALARGFGIELDAGELSRLGRFVALLLENNARLNLTAIRDEDEVWRRHVFDALTLLAVLHELGEGAQIADIGSGGGVPGLPLALACPHLRFTLIEATKKKADFLRAAASALALENVEVLAERAETVGHDSAHREAYDAVIARAVGPLRSLLELTLPLVKVGRSARLVKGARALEELEAAERALEKLHGAHVGTIETPTGRIVVVEKKRRTPKKYPRAPGEPKRAPL